MRSSQTLVCQIKQNSMQIVRINARSGYLALLAAIFAVLANHPFATMDHRPDQVFTLPEAVEQDHRHVHGDQSQQGIGDPLVPDAGLTIGGTVDHVRQGADIHVILGVGQ